MTIYVDNARIRVGQYARWSHLTADTRGELVEFAEQLGLKRGAPRTCQRSSSCWPPERCVHWHHDVTDRERKAALAAGAVSIDIRAWGELCSARRAGQLAIKLP